ncbi:MAG: diguanylate cyclase [Sulfurospirillaceae bacterium]|nr:diguanylate cyclase [Sulfurospirillaceae bacterium]
MEYENIQVALLATLFLLLVYLLLKARGKIASLEKRLHDEVEYKSFMDFLPFPVFYEKKDIKSIYTNKAFDIQFNTNKKPTIETLSNSYLRPVEKMELMYDNDIKRQVMVYSSNIFNENKDVIATIRSIIDVNTLQVLIHSLLENKQRYELSVDNSLFGVWDWDIKKDHFYVSPQWKRIMGYKGDETPKNLNFWLNLVDPKNMANINQAINRHLEGRSDIFAEEHEIKISGETRWISVTGKAIFDSNKKAVRFSGLIFDISDRKQREAINSRSQRLFASFMDNLPAIAFIKDKKSRYVYLNSFYQNYIGFKEWKNKTPLDIFDKEIAKNIMENDRKAFYEGSKEHEELIPNVEGIPKYFEAYKFPIDAGNDEQFICGFAIDITQEKMYLDKINMYAKIFNNTTEGILITDENFNIIATNKAFETNMGYSEKEVIGKNPSLLKPPEQSNDFYNNLYQILKKENKYSGEILIATKEGVVIPELININCIKDAKGKIVNYFAIYQNIAEQKKLERKLTKLAQYDTLTKLPNRFLFKFKLVNALDRVEKNNIKVALVFVDLDDFKNINDTLGHDAGDVVLVHTAQQLLLSVRENDVVARLGGDEFVIILDDIQNIENLQHICEKILKNLNQPFKLLNTKYSINASLGVSISPDHTKNYHDLLKYSDKAMYQAKNSGKNKIVIHEV